MSYSNHHQLAGYLRDTRNVSGYLRSNDSNRYILKEFEWYEEDKPSELFIGWTVFDNEEKKDVDDYYDKATADQTMAALNKDDSFYLDLTTDVLGSDLAKAAISDFLGINLKGKDKEDVSKVDTSALDALTKQMEEDRAKKKKTSRILMIGGGVLAAGGLTYLALRNRN